MDIRAANGTAFDPDQYIIVADGRQIDILHPDTALGARFDQCFH
jgi:hypothetical protein